ncbi:heterokaryon incompatibility protein-domain-containing protein [Dactylonectria macrodidyma]|uniref:Heterokaryon incompatibility protein-domain-containing protein n=1 Tax=Dactylonectria macrodidyma TaxID=307937 RepID=A0A9P9E0S6_9HYPO|nr:heterokaryon incompatibility protein-domain-containing protein [Dactylonectria macrodidyma]
MGLCDVCSEALMELHFRPLRRPEVGFNVAHPQHDQNTRQACWMCKKYSLWLAEYFPATFQAWQSGLLQSSFMPSTQTSIPEKEAWRVTMLGLTLQPVGFSSQDELALEVRLLSVQEFESSTIPGLQTSDPAYRANLVGMWLNQCIGTHEKCLVRRSRLAPWYPTRLLLLGPGYSDVRLIVSAEHDLQGPYMTLSHRWGSSPYTKLTSANMEQFKTQIDIEDLPISFKETMHIAVMAGIRYLWIDSLCIQQDEDKQDWKVEADLMGKVYSHSFLNISATLASDDARSLLDQSDHPFDPMLLNLPCMRRVRVFRVGNPKANLKRYQRRFRKTWIVDNDIWDDDIERAPLQKRGWVFQERFLAPRILHFAERQLAWECHEISALEMFPKRVPPGMMTESRSETVDNVSAAKTSAHADLLEFRRAWEQIVMKYTQTRLTFNKDKLVAFAGVAKIIEEARGDTYLAGLWKSTFIYELAWTRGRHDILHYPLESSFGRAPSWSWLSADSDVLCPFPEKIRKQFAGVVRFPDSVSNGSSATTADGAVILRGLLIPITGIEWDDDGNVSEFTIGSFTLQEGYSSTDTHLDLEGTKEQITELEKSGIALVPLFATDEHLQCIAVACMGTTGAGMPAAFCRVGACQVQYRKVHIHQGSIQPGWIEDPSTLFFQDEPSYRLMHPVACSLIRSVGLALAAGKQRLIGLV